MGALWVVAEPGPDGGLANISAEAATLARDLGATSGRDVIGIVIAADPAPAAKELATYLPVVWAITEPAAGEHAWSAVAAGHIAALVDAADDGLEILPGVDPWKLLTVSAGDPVTVAGEWNRAGFRPMTCWHDDRPVIL
jgi:hypothetical protein